jgi:signal transduction histidine kinase
MMKTIAQELHDNIGQSLSVIKLWMAIAPIEPAHEAFEGVQNSKELLNKAIRDMADLTKNLHTDRITDIGLSEAIRFDLVTHTASLRSLAPFGQADPAGPVRL